MILYKHIPITWNTSAAPGVVGWANLACGLARITRTGNEERPYEIEIGVRIPEPNEYHFKGTMEECQAKAQERHDAALKLFIEPISNREAFNEVKKHINFNEE